MTLTDIRLTEFMGLTEKSALGQMTLKECMTLKEILPTTIFSVKLMHDCILRKAFVENCCKTDGVVLLNLTCFEVPDILSFRS